MSNLRWSILVATIGHRRSEFLRLMDCLMPQVEKYPDIEVVAHFNNGEGAIGLIRKNLIATSSAEYISFIDDDDLVAPDYVDRVYPLLDGVDYIGWKVRFTVNGEPQRQVIHSLEYNGWSQDDNGYYRDISHINPVKRELALEGTFMNSPQVGEDHAWSSSMSGKLKTQHFIDDEMYYYMWTDDSMYLNGLQKRGDFPRHKFKHKQFRWQG